MALITEKIGRIKPPIKWAGGKTQLLSQLRPLYPKRFNLYLEPFVGGGAVFFDLQPDNALLLDSNFELINFYQVVKDNPSELLKDLEGHRNEKDYYYEVRSLDPTQMGSIERASRFLFMNKTCFNGLWRVNKKGKFNVPFGRYKKPNFWDRENLYMVSVALQNTEVICSDFSSVLEYATPGSFVYLDPPYHPLSETSNFTSYTKDSFGKEEQRPVKELKLRLYGMNWEFEIMLSPRAVKNLKALDHSNQKRVKNAIHKLAQFPPTWWER